MTPATEHLAAWIERNAGPLGAWLVQALLWLTSGMSPLAVAGSLAALWWTIERARTERAKRRAIDGYVVQDKRVLRRMMDRFRTRPGPLESRIDP